MLSGLLRRNKQKSHAEMRDLLSPYLDGRLSVGQTADVEAHIQRCEQCRRELEALRVTRSLLQTLPQVRLPRTFTLESAPKPHSMPRSFTYLRAATAFAAAVFAALLAARAVLPLATAPTTDGAPDSAVQLSTHDAYAPTQSDDSKAIRPAANSTAAGVQPKLAPAPQAAPTSSAANPAAAPQRAAVPATPVVNGEAAAVGAPQRAPDQSASSNSPQVGAAQAAAPGSAAEPPDAAGSANAKVTPGMTFSGDWAASDMANNDEHTTRADLGSEATSTLLWALLVATGMLTALFTSLTLVTWWRHR